MMPSTTAKKSMVAECLAGEWKGLEDLFVATRFLATGDKDGEF